MSPAVFDAFMGTMLAVAVIAAGLWFVFFMIDVVDWIDEKSKPPAPPFAF